MTLDDWYATAAADADRRNLADLTPVLKGLRSAAEALRAASWNDDATGRTDAGATATSGSAAVPGTTSGAAPAPASTSASTPATPRASS